MKDKKQETLKFRNVGSFVGADTSRYEAKLSNGIVCTIEGWKVEGYGLSWYIRWEGSKEIDVYTKETEPTTTLRAAKERAQLIYNDFVNLN